MWALGSFIGLPFYCAQKPFLGGVWSSPSEQPTEKTTDAPLPYDVFVIDVKNDFSDVVNWLRKACSSMSACMLCACRVVAGDAFETYTLPGSPIYIVWPPR